MKRKRGDRGQTVVRDSPCRIVRDPRYSGIIPFFLGIPEALGSGRGFLAAGEIGALFGVRTAIEDRKLADGLPGYRDFSRQTPADCSPEFGRTQHCTF